MKYPFLVSVLTVWAAISFAPPIFGDLSADATTAPIVELVNGKLMAIGYREGSLLTHNQIEAVLAELTRNGVEIKDSEQIVTRAVPDNSVLRLQFSSKAGQRFLHKVGQIPGGFSYLERLSEMPQGKELTKRLQNDPGGEKLIEYLATTHSGHRLGSMTAKGQRGVNLNQPTDRIYTSNDLIQALVQLRSQPSYSKD